jgi:hypothetical protein
MKGRAILFVLVFMLLLPQVVAAQEDDPFPDSVWVTVWTRVNLPGRYTWLIAGGLYYIVTDASWNAFGCGVGDLAHLLEIQGRGIYDAHCTP